MPEYQVIARRFRPQQFSQVLGQEAIVVTLKNAIKRDRLATAYLFCGSRGTGKTTLARVFAKALNCAHPTEEGEPCNQCPSCKEISQGISLDVLEIDGASHRGIDDVRQINETVGYAASSGKYKIYIIDEVHMLTKEAFNALLKTLEEPPPKVKFFFATTEPHKVIPTILSRCQRFNLNRISSDTIAQKLAKICKELSISIDPEALMVIAKRAEGGLRDAESILDQIIAFHEGAITATAASDILGIMPREVLFTLDKAGKMGDYGVVFTVSEQLFNQGKDFIHFVEMFIEHIRTILMIKLGAALPASLTAQQTEKETYRAAAELYSIEQCMTILDILVEGLTTLRFAPSPRFALESLMLKVLRTHHRIPIDVLVKRLAELETRSNGAVAPSTRPVEQPKEQPLPPPPPPKPETVKPEPVKLKSISAEALPQHRYDTLLQFAAVELEGTVQIKKINRQPLPST